MLIIKLVVLSIMRIINCFNKEKGIFIFCVFLHIVISFTCMVCYAFLIDTARIQAETRDTVRTYQVFFENGKNIDAAEQTRILRFLERNPYSETEQIVWRFSLFYKDNDISAMAFSNLSTLNMGVKGIRISELDNNSNKRVLLLPLFSLPDTPLFAMKETVDIGQLVNLNGHEYEVIGVQNFYNFAAVHIPLIAGLNDFKLRQIDIILPVGTDEISKKSFSEYLSYELPSARIISPLMTDERALLGISIILFAGVAAILCAVLTFVQMYLFFIKRDRYEYMIMLVCGCSDIKGKLILLFQFNIIFLLSFIISVLLAELVISHTGRMLLPFHHVCIIYFVFATVITTIMLILVSNKKQIARNKGDLVR
jgi:hypothetical protein